jgi:N-acyl homoserine lactone hydrolase
VATRCKLDDVSSSLQLAGGVRIHALRTGTVRVKAAQIDGDRRSAAALLFSRKWTPALPIVAWLVEHPEGRILVDVGETSRAALPGHFPRWHPYFRLAVRESVTPLDDIAVQLAAMNLRPEDVRDVVLTHLHTDHVGGLHAFEHARIHVTADEFRAARGLPGELRGYLPRRLPAWMSPTLIEFGDGSREPLARGWPLTRDKTVVVFPTPGHTVGHCSVMVDDGTTRVLLAGDASYTQAAMLAGVADGVGVDAAASRRTLAALRALTVQRPTVYLPSHDPESPRRLAAAEPAPHRNNRLCPQGVPAADQGASE